MDEAYLHIKNLIKQYLRETSFSRIACLTNEPPNKFDQKYLIANFNYITFCASNFLQKSQILLLLFLKKYRNVQIDICQEDIDKCLIGRQYAYLCLSFDNADITQEKLNFISSNKNKINNKYPILIRLLCAEELSSLILPQHIEIKYKLSENDLLLRLNNG